jgi:hypothetical protein
MKKFPLLVLAFAAASALAQTTPITVANYDFSIVPAGGLTNSCGIPNCGNYSDFTSVSDGIPGWTASGDLAAGGGYGQFAPTAIVFNGYDGTTPTAFSNGPTLNQIVGTTVVPGYTYTLTVDIGYRDDLFNFEGGADLLINGVAYDATGTKPAKGDFSAYTVTYTGLAADSGDPIEIQLTAPTNEGNFSEVTLTQTVPEGGASSLYLLLAGLCCFGATFASRKELGNRA